MKLLSSSKKKAVIKVNKKGEGFTDYQTLIQSTQTNNTRAKAKETYKKLTRQHH